MKTPLTRKKKYTIIIGLNDKDEKTQKIETDRILHLIRNCCKGYSVAFSGYMQDGGYIHENGEYVLEKSVCISFVGADENVIEELAKDLCAFLNQESVLITVEDVEYYFVPESV